MKIKKIILVLIMSVVGYFTGEWLMSIYGLDPPYIFYDSGFILQIISSISFAVFFALLIAKAIKK